MNSPFRPAAINQRKRDNVELSAGEIQAFIAGVVDGSVSDSQLGAFLMAVCCSGMSAAETAALTLAMRDSGRVLHHPTGALRPVDKHSTGGVGDKVSLLLAPWVAAAGVRVPMISGRGLGHTGGTLDKLESIPGYRVDLSPTEFDTVLSRCGFAMAGASEDIAPADRRMYATRDVTGTVASAALITSSILSKKLAEGIGGLVMDVKCGRAAFLRSAPEADALIESLLTTGRAAGLDMVCWRTDMDHPLGRAIGNALEVREVIDCLRGEGPADLMELTRELAAEMLVLSRKTEDLEAARAELDDLMASGTVEDSLRANLEAQGGDVKVLDDPSRLPNAPVHREVLCECAGFVADIDPLALGQIIGELGGGRSQATDPVDPSVGVRLDAVVGDSVELGTTLATVHAATDTAAEVAVARLCEVVQVADQPGPRAKLLQARRTTAELV